jgi:protein-disulfide isomerase
LFPLDSSCNWMLDRSLHPGACLLSGAVLCSADNNNARAALEWSYDNQDDLREAGKAGEAALKKKISDKLGPAIAACASDKKTAQRLTKHLHHAANNRVPVSTPQMFLGDKRVCEEDTDLGLKYTLAQLAPAVVK